MGQAEREHDVTRSRRSYAALTDPEMERLSTIALDRHRELAGKRPDWCSELLAACLVQGAARHRVHGDRGIKDLDVYLLYPLAQGSRSNAFPFLRGTQHRDFGSSAHGQELYTDSDRENPSVARRIDVWEHFLGRRVDLLARAIPTHPDGAQAAVLKWIQGGADKAGQTPWHLARCPVVALWPDLGAVWWEGPADDVAGVEKGTYDQDP